MKLNNYFWSFSIGFYQDDWVKDLLLTWQNEKQISVNLCLWSLWLGYQGHPLGTKLLLRGIQSTHDLNTLLQSCRDLRTKVKTHSIITPKCYRRLLEVELKLERLFQAILYDLSPMEAAGFAKREDLIKENLIQYLKTVQVEFGYFQDDIHHLVNQTLAL